MSESPRPELLSFLGAIKADPEEDTPKLALADWLQEQPNAADNARGEFLRQFVRNNQLSKTDPAREDFGALSRLWNSNEEAWAGRLKAAGFKVWATNHMFRWGLLFPALDWGTDRDADAIELVGTEEYAWVAGLTVRALDAGAVPTFTAYPLLDSLVGLRIARSDSDDFLLEDVCNSPRAAGLRFLDLSGWSPSGYPELLARTPHLSGLRELRVRQCGFADGDFQVLCNAERLEHLRSLDVAGNNLTRFAAAAFADGHGLPALEELNLGTDGYARNRIGPFGLQALIAGKRSGRLQKLHLSNNDIGTTGVEALCAAPNMCNLTHLDLSANLIGNEGLSAIAEAEHLNTLEHLNLSGNAVTDDGALALANSPYLTNIRRLALTSSRRIRKTTAAALRERFGDRVILDPK